MRNDEGIWGRFPGKEMTTGKSALGPLWRASMWKELSPRCQADFGEGDVRPLPFRDQPCLQQCFQGSPGDVSPLSQVGGVLGMAG